MENIQDRSTMLPSELANMYTKTVLSKKVNSLIINSMDKVDKLTLPNLMFHTTSVLSKTERRMELEP